VHIRKIGYRYFEGIYKLVQEIYDENPFATWFYERPSREVLEAIVATKIIKVKENEAIDYLAINRGEIIGECEIIKDQLNRGWLGILVKKDYRGKKVGSKLFEKCIKESKRLGIKELLAEVYYDNSAIDFFKKKGFEIKGIEETQKGKIVLLAFNLGQNN